MGKICEKTQVLVRFKQHHKPLTICHFGAKGVNRQISYKVKKKKPR